MTYTSTAPIDRELELFKQGYRYIIGFDEAGRGAIAGPVHVGWAVLPLVNAIAFQDKEKYIRGIHRQFHGVRDSKKIRSTKTATAHEKRMKLVNANKPRLISGGSLSVTAKHIDDVGINIAIHGLVDMAIERAIADIATYSGNGYPEPTTENVYLLCDNGLYPDLRDDYRGEEIVKGDFLSVTIAMASLFAKTDRDAYMFALHEKYPVYDFADHKGYYAYGKPHMEVAQREGIIREYRRSYAPISDWVALNSVKILEE